MNSFAVLRTVGNRSLTSFSIQRTSSLLRPQQSAWASTQPTYSPFVRYLPTRNFAEITVKVPNLGDSVTEGNIASWLLKEGEFANKDQIVLTLETEKVGHEITAPEAGTIVKIFGKAGSVVNPGKPLFTLDTEKKASASAPSPASAAAPAKAETKQTKADAPAPPSPPSPPSPSAPASGARASAPAPPPPAPAAPKPAEAPKAAAPAQPVAAPEAKSQGSRDVERVPISRMRKTIATNMKNSQNTLAMLTTFQECDMSGLSNLREKYKEEFAKKHNVKLGFMSAFVKASAIALQEIPAVNAVIEGEEVVYHKYVDISVAVATPRGLVTPVVRNCESLSFADIEKWIGFYSAKARDNKISMDELKGGTFTISNGGVFGSLMGTPIVNPGQSAILGLHAIKDRAVVVDGQIVIRPMMFLALTYDHRLIDGREAVTFLKRVKELVEEPSTMLLS